MMTIPFAQSRTRINLMRAFAGESQARNRYTFAAALARENKLELIARTFEFTAEQEKEHAEIFYDQLASLCGQSIRIDGGFPVDTASSVLEQLKSARHNEFEEHDTVYADFACVAQQEGFCAISETFTRIAAIERLHGERFGRFADMLEEGTLFRSPCPVAWFCLNCGHVHFADSAPADCPVCHHDQGFFIRADLTPFVMRP